jgi:hypothetical protein
MPPLPDELVRRLAVPFVRLRAPHHPGPLASRPFVRLGRIGGASNDASHSTKSRAIGLTFGFLARQWIEGESVLTYVALRNMRSSKVQP